MSAGAKMEYFYSNTYKCLWGGEIQKEREGQTGGSEWYCIS